MTDRDPRTEKPPSTQSSAPTDPIVVAVSKDRNAGGAHPLRSFRRFGHGGPA